MRHSLRISPSITAKQQELLEDVRRKVRIFTHLQWNTGESTNVFLTKQNRLLTELIALRDNHTAYNKRPYEIKSLTVVEKTNRNPHIKLNL